MCAVWPPSAQSTTRRRGLRPGFVMASGTKRLNSSVQLLMPTETRTIRPLGSGFPRRAGGTAGVGEAHPRRLVPRGPLVRASRIEPAGEALVGSGSEVRERDETRRRARAVDRACETGDDENHEAEKKSATSHG